MKKIRVYEAAKDFHVSSEALLEIIRGLGIEVKSHMSSIDDDAMAKLKQKFVREVEVAKEELARMKEKEAVRAKETAQAHPRPSPPRPAPPRPSPSQPYRSSQGGQSSPSQPYRSSQGGQSSPSQPYRSSPGGQSPPSRSSSSYPSRSSSSPRPQSSYSPGAPQGSGPPSRPGFGPPASPGQSRFGGGPGGPRGQKPRGGKKKRRTVDERAVAENVKRTLSALDSGTKAKVHRRREREDGTVVEEEVKLIKATEFITVADLAQMLEMKPQEVIAACMRLGVMANINRRLDKTTIEAVADEFGFAVEFVEEFGADTLQEPEDAEVGTSPRAPVVTIMGHVDHGKTSLLDYIRRTNVAGGETGGITQHIGAYRVKAHDKAITFLDTPGHEAFTSMRARGAQVTDIVILVVAADDRIMPQTIEAIDHARDANVPIIVAINKVDLPSARADLVRSELTKYKLVAEEFGGDVIMCEVSAKKGTGIEHLLDMILLKAELMELKASPARRAKGTVIEARKEPGRGTLVTVLVQNGTLHVGDAFVAGRHFGKVRALSNDLGERVTEAGPSEPVEIMGFSDAPTAGDTLQAVAEDREAREIAGKRHQLQREQEFRAFRHVTLTEFSQRIQKGEASELRLIIKADVDGSAEALSDHLAKLSTDEVKLRIVHSGVGNVSETDVLLAAAADAVVIAFRVKIETRARDAGAREKVDIRSYEIIYKAEEDIRDAMSGLLKPEIRETVLGAAEIRNVFKLSRAGVVAGCFVTSGNIPRNAKVRLLRAGEKVHEGKISTLKRFKDDVKEVANGFECGLQLEGYNDIKVGDILEAFQLEEVARTLA